MQVTDCRLQLQAIQLPAAYHLHLTLILFSYLSFLLTHIFNAYCYTIACERPSYYSTGNRTATKDC